MVTEAQVTGSIVGLAVGDALGYPAEFRERAQILQEIGPDGITDFISYKDPRFTKPVIVGADHPPGTYSDDTQMTIAVGEALLAAESHDLDEIMEEMGRRFVSWSGSPDNNRAPGGACMEGCENLRRGVPWREAGVQHSKGCGSAMRVAPIGLRYSNLDRVVEVARASSLLTHGHDAAVEGAAAAALMVALALEGLSPDEMYREIERQCFTRSADFSKCLEKLTDFIDRPPEEVLTEDGIGEGWVAEEAVASALYCVWRFPDDFEKAVLTGVNTDGDSDSIATITGSIMGARLGLEAIPERWRNGVESSSELLELGARLWAARNRLPAD